MGAGFPRLSFHGAARAVTGSCYRLETAGGTILVDCGMFQGSKTERALNERAFAFHPAGIDAVLLTHAHIDHSGLLPKLVKDGFSGPIHATAPTADLCGVMLPDSAHIQQVEAQRRNTRRARWDKGAETPLYDDEDVDRTLAQLRTQELNTWFPVISGTRARFWNAGHVLGSGSIEVEPEIPGHNTPVRLLFSGDLGPAAKLLQPDPQGPAGVDYVICESTYGGTDRPATTPDARRAVLAAEVKAAMHAGGPLLIPSFAVERAQELIADLTLLMIEGTLPMIPVYVDSPMAARATALFFKHRADLENDGRILQQAAKLRHLHFTQSVDESKALDHIEGFHIVIAASGMCEAGRIRHRLRRWIWSETATVLLVGYQAAGTLGRILLEGARNVRIHGQDYAVHARIRSLDLYSGHADAPELMTWIAARMPIARGIFLTHGEPPAANALAQSLRAAHPDLPVLLPALDQAFDLTPAGAQQAGDAPAPRLRPEHVANIDWNNEASALYLDVNEALHAQASDKKRAALVRHLRRALEDWENG